MKQRRNACLVDLILVVSDQVAVEMLSLTKSKAEYAFNLRAALDYFLTHPQLCVLNLFYLSKFVADLCLRMALTAAVCAGLHF